MALCKEGCSYCPFEDSIAARTEVKVLGGRVTTRFDKAVWDGRLNANVVGVTIRKLPKGNISYSCYRHYETGGTKDTDFGI